MWANCGRPGSVQSSLGWPGGAPVARISRAPGWPAIGSSRPALARAVPSNAHNAHGSRRFAHRRAPGWPAIGSSRPARCARRSPGSYRPHERLRAHHAEVPRGSRAGAPFHRTRTTRTGPGGSRIGAPFHRTRTTRTGPGGSRIGARLGGPPSVPLGRR